jgi:hypothetical protein
MCGVLVGLGRTCCPGLGEGGVYQADAEFRGVSRRGVCVLLVAPDDCDFSNAPTHAPNRGVHPIVLGPLVKGAAARQIGYFQDGEMVRHE